MLICDKVLMSKRMLLPIFSIWSVLVFLFAVNLFLPSFEIIPRDSRVMLVVVLILAGFSLVVLFIYKVRRAQNTIIFDDITCGEITDTLILLDAIVNGNIGLVYSLVSADNIEGFLSKIAGRLRDLGTQLQSTVDKYELIRVVRSRRRLLIVDIVVDIALLVFLGYASLSYDFGALLYGDAIMYLIFALTVLVGGLTLLMFNLISVPRAISDIEDQDLEILDRAIKNIVELLSENISSPIAISLTGRYPGTRRERYYVVIQPKVK